MKIGPYTPPASPSSIRHVALAAKRFRVFGLTDPAWRNAREEWKRYKAGGAREVRRPSSPAPAGGPPLRSALKTSSKFNGGRDRLDNSFCDGCSSDDDDDAADGQEGEEGGTGADAEVDEQAELELICKAVDTALSEDAGGHGTAGFHTTTAEYFQLLTDLDGNNNGATAVFGAKLVPHDAESNAPLDPMAVLHVDEDTGETKYTGNDRLYLQPRNEDGDDEDDVPPFQLRINISKAEAGLAAKAYHEALFAKRQGIPDDEDGIAEYFGGDDWVGEDEELHRLRQRLIDAGVGRGDGDDGDCAGDPAPGYFVEVLLVDPSVPPDGMVVAPPPDLDRAGPGGRQLSASVRQSSCNAMEGIEEDDEDGDVPPKAVPALQSVFAKDIFTADQFMAPGPWERANIKAFGDLALDVRKALVRVEFPVFPEGCKDRTFREVYQLNARLKSGSFATVCRGTHRATGKKIAVKCVLRKDLPPMDDAAIYDEVLILSTLRHSYICPLIDFFEERECYFLIMELMSGGDLFDRIGKRKSYTENDARDLCRKMLESVRYCHENSVAHCDMKPKNLLLVSDDDDVQIKLADFGFATRVYSQRSLTKQCGTPFFVAPEVLMRSPYDQQSDMWSCGVIMFLLLGGDLPFMGRSQKELFRNIVMGRYQFEEEGWAHVSEQAKDLVQKLLITDPSRRLTSREAMASPWMRQRGNMLAMNNLQYTSQRLKGFNARMKLRAGLITVRSTVSMRFSLANLKSASAKSMRASRQSSEEDTVESDSQPSFLAELPVEGGEEGATDVEEED